MRAVQFQSKFAFIVPRDESEQWKCGILHALRQVGMFPPRDHRLPAPQATVIQRDFEFKHDASHPLTTFKILTGPEHDEFVKLVMPPKTAHVYPQSAIHLKSEETRPKLETLIDKDLRYFSSQGFTSLQKILLNRVERQSAIGGYHRKNLHAIFDIQTGQLRPEVDESTVVRQFPHSPPSTPHQTAAPAKMAPLRLFTLAIPAPSNHPPDGPDVHHAAFQ